MGCCKPSARARDLRSLTGNQRRPPMAKAKEAGTNGRTVRIGAMADLHCSKNSQGLFQPLLTQAAAQVDLLLLAGDLTDYGLTEEAHILARELSGVKIPMVAVLGNHD